MSLAIAIMAAGKGTRMKSSLAKVLHQAQGKPMIEHVLETSKMLNPKKIVLIVGHQADAVKEATLAFGADYALQEPQLGTGHAVMQTEAALKDFAGNVLILSGDVPLVTAKTLQHLLDTHNETGATATVLTAELDDPTGYGRVIRDASGAEVHKIVEHKDASDEERDINEINSGIYVFEKKALFDALSRIDNHNAQSEYYLPDVFKIFFADGKKVTAVKTSDFDEIRGVNTVEQLTEAENILNARETTV
ncbi:Nucleotidyl transferase [Chloroherpeton thalassium ATCC 35110]|uniref:Nucleotidyl transferase n=1 Tax=Chloroherpeton thalassium (strain ATCC 35110 / GB-78) TaxID=517418 RepID=B3QTQ2_CHLT3|nr:sugar phosphate nucleotidyltransferase [Chloroherpeton thalassium]ACF14250.1 Nucleotidyl transferase [Chloroherpeton thalassium ATCC 35110]